MKKIISNIYQTHRNFWDKSNFLLLVTASIWFSFAIFLQYFAYRYIDNYMIGTPVGDLILNNLPSINSGFFIVQGALFSTLVVSCLLIVKPRYMSFSLKALALFIVIRSFFISLTHLGVNLDQITLNTNSLGFIFYDFLYYSENDFFFSGHVGATFLFALIFWKEKIWRMVFLAFSVVFGISMLFAHLHYSIDIFAAPLITYSIFAISRYLFAHDYKLIN